MKPTTMADISSNSRSVVMSAMPDCFRMVVSPDLIVQALAIYKY